MIALTGAIGKGLLYLEGNTPSHQRIIQCRQLKSDFIIKYSMQAPNEHNGRANLHKKAMIYDKLAFHKNGGSIL